MRSATDASAIRARNTFGNLLSAALLLGCLIFAGGSALAEDSGESPENTLHWQRGPMTAPIGDNLAEIVIDEAFVFLDATETRRFMEMTHNPVSGSEMATLAPIEDGDWFLVFDFEEVGYVSDEEKDDLDADALLDSIRQGTEAANAERRERGWTEMHIVGWQEEPHYDDTTNNLSWAIIGESEGSQNINRTVKLLGRSGVMTVTLVASRDELQRATWQVENLLQSYNYRPGSTYAEYVPGKDKLAQYGLTALVVGGAGAALLKSGLLARLWKPIAIALAGLVAGVRRFFMGGRSSEHDIDKPVG